MDLTEFTEFVVFVQECLKINLHSRKTSFEVFKKYALERGFSSAGEYMRYVKKHLDEELPNLHDKSLIHTTSFARDTRFWKAVHAHFFARLEPGRAVRILSLGCSNGAELATAAILAHQRIEPRDFEIHAWDISPACIEAAKNPICDKRFLPQLPLPVGKARTSVVFLPDSRFELVPELKASIYTHLGDVRGREGDWWGAETGAYDLVLCRNLLVYLDPGAVRETYKAAWTSLKHRRGEGFLGVGGSENRPPKALFKGVDAMLYRPINRPR